jgi:hypothetical protein
VTGGRRPRIPAALWYVVATGAAVVAVAGLGLLALVVTHDTLGLSPTRVERGRTVGLPARNYLADRVALYGVLPAGRDAAALDLGCDLSDVEGAGGRRVEPPAAGSHPLTVAGRRLDPIASIPDPGLLDVLTCDGPDLDAVSPVYVVGTSVLQRAGRGVLVGLLGAVLLLTLPVAVASLLLARQAGRLRRPGDDPPVP